MARATGDEKHDESSTSTLDALARPVRAGPPRRPVEPRVAGARPVHLEQGPRAGRVLRDPRAPRLLPGRSGSTTSWSGAASSGAIPTERWCPGVEASTGSLGHGLPMSVGVALALPARKGSSDQRVVVLTGDAELNEGSNWEAILLAPALHLTNLTLLVIDNHSSQPAHGAVGRQARVVRLVGARRRRTRSRRARSGAHRSRPRPADGGRRRYPGGRVVSGLSMRERAGETAADLLDEDPARRRRARGDQHRSVRASPPGPPGARRQRRDHGADDGRRRGGVRDGGVPAHRPHDHAVPRRTPARADQARLRVPGAGGDVRVGGRLVRLHERGVHASFARRRAGDVDGPGDGGARAGNAG